MNQKNVKTTTERLGKRTKTKAQSLMFGHTKPSFFLLKIYARTTREVYKFRTQDLIVRQIKNIILKIKFMHQKKRTHFEARDTRSQSWQ